MIKKLIFATIIFLGLLTPVSSFAMEFTLPEIYSLGDLGYGLAAGAQWDFTGKDEYLIDNLPQLSPAEIDAAATMRVRHFLEQYAINRGIPYAEDGQVYDNPKDYLISTYFNKTVTSLYQKYQLELEAGNVNADATLRMPISRQRITDWSGYKIGISERYLDSLVYGMDIPDEPDVYPDAAYLQYLENINGTGFDFIRNSQVVTCTQDYNGQTLTAPNVNYPLDSRTYYYNNAGGMELLYFRADTFTLSYNVLIVSDGIDTINIVSNNGTYSATITRPTIYGSYPNDFSVDNMFLYSETYTNNLDPLMRTNYANFCPDRNYLSFDNCNVNYIPWSTYTFTGTLDSVFLQLQKYVRNCNIYVDGVPWDIVSDPAPADPFLPDFPDVINTDYGPIETVDLPATPDNYGTFDITSLFDALKQAIIGASDNDPTTDGTLTKEGVTDTYRDDTGELTGDEDIPLEDAIEDSFPIEDTLNYPEIILPYEPIHNAFMGTTVLSQLIDATQTVLPEELILVFWGIVFILFIIGLIKILHK